MTKADFPPTRAAARARLDAFAPKAGRDYASLRNHDLPGHPHVSQLSPYLRHRVITEDEVIARILQKWAPSTAEKFVQEVVWRTYFKGWLERRPGIWRDYRHGVTAGWNRIQSESGLRADWQAACRGETGIDAFDHWAKELVDTGYLHNHARMWFASIWIFTLKLPWELGADFFLRHLLDGDPASNTLGWRWVAGLHTRGKHYVARADNIAKFTGARFALARLERDPAPLDGPPHPEPLPLRDTGTVNPALRTGLLLTEDDLTPEFATDGCDIRATFVANGATGRSPLLVSENVQTMTNALIDDALARLGDRLGKVTQLDTGATATDALSAWIASESIEQIVLPYLTEGPARDSLAPALQMAQSQGVAVVERRRDYDSCLWPLATAGFFKVKKAIPRMLKDLKLDQNREPDLFDSNWV